MSKLNLGLLAGGNYRVYNYELAKKLGINEAILLADLITKFLYFEERRELIDGGFFFSTAEKIYETTALTRRQQEKSLKNLAEYVETKVKGIPAKKHFRLKTLGITRLIVLPKDESEEEKRLAEDFEKKYQPSFDEKVNPVSTKGRNLFRRKVETISIINNNTKIDCDTASPVSAVSPLQAKKEKEEWNSEAYIEKMKASKQRHIALIGQFFWFKEVVFPSYLACQNGIKRYLRPARALAEYPEEVIDRVVGKVRKNKDWSKIWTLDTILKRILAGD